jgi:mannose-6-phosphate isomerase-like protein (cupin superfamily)
MRLTFVALLVMCAGTAAMAQAQAPADARLFASSAEVTALIERAKAERQADQANFVQPVVRSAPFAMNLEYRVGGLNANATAHDTEAEVFVVVEGSGTLVTGGTIRDERRTNAANRAGTAIDGGARRTLSKGDVALVPEGVPHWFTDVNGTLVLLSMHLPRPAGQ